MLSEVKAGVKKRHLCKVLLLAGLLGFLSFYTQARAAKTANGRTARLPVTLQVTIAPIPIQCLKADKPSKIKACQPYITTTPQTNVPSETDKNSNGKDKSSTVSRVDL